MKTYLRILSTAALLWLGLFTSGQAAGLTPDQRLEVEAIIRDYLIKNPELLREMGDLLQAKEKAGEELLRQNGLAGNADLVFRDPGDFVAGNPKGDVTMVEFFDYNCGWCKKGLPEVVSLIESDKELRLVLKEFPIFGEDSEYAARAAIAARQQGKYWELHLAMMGHEGKLAKESVDELVAALGLDVEKLKADMEAPATFEIINRTRELASALAINGTPAFIIDDTLIPGYLPQAELAETIAKVREKGCALC